MNLKKFYQKACPCCGHGVDSRVKDYWTWYWKRKINICDNCGVNLKINALGWYLSLLGFIFCVAVFLSQLDQAFSVALLGLGGLLILFGSIISYKVIIVK